MLYQTSHSVGNQSVNSLYLSYSLWISELNAGIDTLSVFEEYMRDHNGDDNHILKTAFLHFRRQFATLRKYIDDIKHEMHLVKMELAAYTRDGKMFVERKDFNDAHRDIRNRYNVFNAQFEQAKLSFVDFENSWLLP
ncbi:MAG: hypothetical protein QM731_10430 [Chitinophagaceae bacterium]